MRIDRDITVHFIGPLTKWYLRDHIPILMYHSVAPDIKENSHPYFRLNTTPGVFEEHLSLLKSHNFEIVDLSKIPSLLTSLHHDRHYAVLTFDDGIQNFYEYAFPLLQKYSMPATMFLPTGLVGSTEKTPYGGYLSWKSVIEMSKYNIKFGSHTINHVNLIDLKPEQIITEIADSKKKIEDTLCKKVTQFSFPYRFPQERPSFKNSMRNLLLQSGYSIGVTTILGTNTDSDELLFLKRLPVNNCDDDSLFNAKLCGDYDWMYYTQWMVKKIKGLLINKIGIILYA